MRTPPFAALIRCFVNERRVGQTDLPTNHPEFGRGILCLHAPPRIAEYETGQRCDPVPGAACDQAPRAACDQAPRTASSKPAVVRAKREESFAG